ncbi:MAG: hypothetical protein R3325_15640, partial [Thermoanaerobaculia bacterium]|nr:hypothetical protein [Thermoanaerobaculia bacterium]
EVVAVNFQEDPEAARAFLRGKRLDVPVYLDRDGALSKRAANSHLPGLLVFSGGQRTFVGQLPRDPNAAIGRALGIGPGG